MILWLSNCSEHSNFTLFILSGALYGFAVLPTFAATIVCAVECTYPLPAEVSFGRDVCDCVFSDYRLAFIVCFYFDCF